jgi:hypothetical protein
MREFMRVTLYPTRVLLQLVPNVIMAPLSMTTAVVIVKIAEGGAKTEFYVFAVLMVILYVFNAALWYIVQLFLDGSAFLTENPFGCFRASKHCSLFITNSILAFAHVLFQLFDGWTNCFIIAVHFASCVQMFINFLDLVFIRTIASEVLLTFMIAEPVMDVMSFFQYATASVKAIPVIDCKYILIMTAGVLVISFIIVHVVVGKKTKRIKKELAYNREDNVWEQEVDEENRMDDAEKVERFVSLGLGESDSKMECYLLQGLARASDLFTDFSLVKYATQKFPTDSMLSFCLRLETYFPFQYREAGVS